MSQNMARGTETLSQAVGRYAQSLTTFGRSMTANVSIPLSLVAAQAVKSAVTYEDTISKMSRLADASASDAARWSEQILRLSKSVAVGPNELAEALYQVASSGVPVKEAFGILEVSAKGAGGGLGALMDVARLATTTTNVYGRANLSAARTLDIVTEAVRLGSGETNQFATALGRITPVAAQLGVDFRDLGAGMAVLTNRGLSVAEAGTGVRQMFMNLLKPSAAAQKHVARLGTSYADIRRIFAEQGLLAGMKELQRLSGGNNETLAKLLPNVRGLNAYLSIMASDTMPETERIFADMRDSVGELDAMFEKATDTAKFKFNQALAATETAGIRLGTVALPYVAKAVSFVADLFEKVAHLSPGWQKFIAGATGLLIALGPAVYLLGTLGRLFSFLLSPVGLLAVVVGGLAYAGYRLYQTWEPFTKFIDDKVIPAFKGIPDAWRTIQSAWSSRGADTSELEGWGGRVVDTVGFAARTLDAAKVEIPKAWGVIQSGFAGGDSSKTSGWFEKTLFYIGVFSRVVKDLAVDIGGYIKTIVAWVADKAPGAFRALISGVWAAIQWLTTNVPVAISAVVSFISSVVGWVNTHVVPTIEAAFEFFVAALTPVVAAVVIAVKLISKAVSWFWDVFGPVITTTMRNIWEIISTAFNAIWDVVRNVMNLIKSLIENALRIIRGVFQTFTGILTGDWRKLWEGLKNIVGGVLGAIGSVITTAFRTIKDTLFTILGGIRNMVVNTWNGIVDFIGGIGGKIGRAASGMWDGIKAAFRGVINWIIRAWNAIEFKIPGFSVGPVKWDGFTLGVPKIPELANGALVRSPTLALIGEAGDEVVFPVNNPHRGFALLQQAGVLGGREVGASAETPPVQITYAPTFTIMNPRDAAEINEREMAWLMKTNGR